MTLLPALSILILALFALLPWGGGDTARFAAAMMPMLAIRYWAIRRPDHVPAALAFATGLLLDVVSYGPLGFWALIALAALGLGRITVSLHHAPSLLWSAASLMIASAVLALLAWLVSSIYFSRPVPWQPTALGAFAAVALSPLLNLFFDPLDRLWGGTRAGLFTRERLRP